MGLTSVSDVLVWCRDDAKAGLEALATGDLDTVRAVLLAIFDHTDRVLTRKEQT